MKALGLHLLAELYDCDAAILNDPVQTEEILKEAVTISGATYVKSVFHQFSPHGVTGVVVIAESHFSIHTWPEFGYCAIDIFTCGDTIDRDKALHFIIEKVKCRSTSIMEVKRGVLNIPPGELQHKPPEV